jgi:hypothetical protein
MHTPVKWRKPVHLAAALAVAHTFLLAAYTFPQEWVPTRLRYWSQAYARVFFHQDWRLFAPDPPACACSLEVLPTPAGEWEELANAHSHFVWRRMAANACRFGEALVRPGDTVIDAPIALTVSLEQMAEELPRKDTLRVRIVRRCPDERIIPVRLQAHR